MDDRTGNLFSGDQMAAMMAGRNFLNETAKRRLDQELSHLVLTKLEPTEQQKRRGRIGRNELCPCGSGKKFKRCHLKEVKS